MNGWKHALLTGTLFGCAVLGASFSNALPQLDESQAGWNSARNLDRISLANRITTYQPVDATHLVLVADEEMNYLLSLETMCHELRFARQIGVSNSDNTIYAGFDHVVADGQECPIARIQAISAEMAQRLNP